MFGVVHSRLMSIASAMEQSAEVDWGVLDNYGGEERFALSLDRLTDITGLHRETVVSAKAELHRRRIICWSRKFNKIGGDAADLVAPNPEFVVRFTQPPDKPTWWTFIDWGVVTKNRKGGGKFSPT